MNQLISGQHISSITMIITVLSQGQQQKNVVKF